jgi:hypothetical protein
MATSNTTSGSGNGEFNTANKIIVSRYAVTPESVTNRYFIVDTLNHRIQQCAAGYSSQFGSYGSGILQFDNPKSICSDGTDLFLADTGNARIVKVDDHGNYISTFTGYTTPEDIDFNSKGHFWVLDTGKKQIVKHLASGAKVLYIGGSEDTARFTNPIVADVDSSDNVYVLDYDNVSTYTLKVFKDDSLEYSVKASFDFNRNGVGDGNTELFNPSGIYIYGDKLFISDTENDCVKVFTLGGLL